MEEELDELSSASASASSSSTDTQQILPGNIKTIRIAKPENWSSLPMYRKIRHYRTQLTDIYGSFADKLVAKQIIETFCDEDELKVAPVVRILNNIDDITEEDICSNHLLKATHGSNWTIDFDITKDVTVIKKHLMSWNRCYSYVESHYKYIRPRFFIEEKICDLTKGITGSATVYMIRCIYNKPYTIGVVDKKGGYNLMYDISWNKVIPSRHNAARPLKLDKMLELAERLSVLFEFVRVDFYIGTDNELYFSEFTFTPSGGNRIFSEELEMEMGRPWI